MMWWGLKQHIKVEKIAFAWDIYLDFENGITNFLRAPGGLAAIGSESTLG